jgi:hypothetical protein
MATRWGHYPPASHGPPLCARRTAGWPGEWCHAPGVCGRRFRTRACGRLDPRGAPEGQKQGKGHTSLVAARASGPTLRVVRSPCARRRRHGHLPGQGPGHLPCRMSRPVSRRHVAVGGTVSTVAPPRDLASVLRRPRILGRVEGSGTGVVQWSGHPTVTAGECRERGAPLILQGHARRAASSSWRVLKLGGKLGTKELFRPHDDWQ